MDKPAPSRTADNQPQEATEEGIVVESYEPYDHRGAEGEKLVSDFEAWTNMVKSAVGTGLFAMPNAFSFVGMIIGIVGTFCLGALITVALQMLVATHYQMCKREKVPSLNYGEVCHVAVKTGPENIRKWSDYLICMVDSLLMICYIGIGAVYVVFIAGVAQELVDNEKTIHLAYYCLMLFPFMLAMNMVRSLKCFAYLSILGNLFLLVAAIIAVVYSFKDGIGDNYKYIRQEVQQYPRFIGTAFFSLCSPGLILSIEHNMKHPAHYPGYCGVLNWGMFVVIGTHVFVGIAGYLKWGEDAEGNFIRNQKFDAGTIVALSMQALSMYFSYGLQCYMPMTILAYDYALPALEAGHCCGPFLLWEVIVRTSLTLVTCVLAATIPKLELFISLVGAFCIASLGMLIPVLLDILVHCGNYGAFRWKLWVVVIMLVIGFTAMACAAVFSIVFIVRFFAHGDE